ncbi:monooxygenase [Cladophialophora chaetospira]|uniref:Monooxygenase n=1 Tax=Cladophialophora chaetospira TaxID=386627 RepID=A0AA38X0W0_9EURO|nr:monooxygenase [Cladophialophora chaetospira]
MGDAGPSTDGHGISRIAIIGAGPVGVSCAKYLVAEKAFSTIDIYEQRDRVGGIWNLSEPVRSKRIPIPQIDPRYGHDQNGAVSETLDFESPLYDYLETNIPKQLMAFSDKPFPEDEPLFPSHQAVLRYLEQYAEDVRHSIRFSTAVKNVRPASDASGKDKWDLTAETLTTKETVKERYDAIVIANGHYTIPYVPDIKGVKEWNSTYPGVILHSKAYRRPEDFQENKVIVIGNSASGLDIAVQLGKHARFPVLLSSRSASAFGTLPAGGYREDVDEIVEFLQPQENVQRAVRFKSGRIEKDVDAVIFATGYFYSYPFLSKVFPSVVTDGLRARGTFEHLFSIDHPTLAFPVINLKVIPFPLSQNQAAVVARVWSRRLQLPSTSEMRDWEQEVIQERGDGKHFHLKKFPEDAAQINGLFAWALKADKKEGLENDGIGKLGTNWNERQVWMRSRFPDIKAAYSASGEDRLKVRTMEELGFDFDQWRDHADDNDLELFVQAKCLQTSSRY